LKKLLNTLYVTKEGAYLHRERETIIVEVEREKVLQLPIHTIKSVVCMGHGIMVSPGLMTLCCENSVTISFFTENGKFIANVVGPQSGNVLLRKEQYRRSDSLEKSGEIARMIVGAKISNSRAMLQRCTRNYPDHDNIGKLNEVISRLSYRLQQVKSCNDLDILRGIEGESANDYFGCFNYQLTAKETAFIFSGRNRRPPLDPVNAMLSFTYTLLHHDVASALEGVGLDPAVGFLHRDRPGRNSLALDVMEEFRAYVADRLVISMINLGQIKSKDFEITDSGAVNMSDTARKDLITAYQKRKQDEIKHPFLDESVKIGLIPHIQALLLARYLRGDLDIYPAFVVK